MKVIGVGAVAARLQMGRKAIQRWTDRGLFKAVVRTRSGHRRYDADEVERIREWLFDGGPVRVIDPFPPGRKTSTADGRIGVAEAARRCQVSLTTVQEWADMGRLPCVRNGRNERRFLEADVALALRWEPATVAPLPGEPRQEQRPGPRRGIDLIDDDEL